MWDIAQSLDHMTQGLRYDWPKEFIDTPTCHHCDVTFFSDVIRHSSYFSEVMWNSRHSSLRSCDIPDIRCVKIRVGSKEQGAKKLCTHFPRKFQTHLTKTNESRETSKLR